MHSLHRSDVRTGARMIIGGSSGGRGRFVPRPVRRDRWGTSPHGSWALRFVKGSSWANLCSSSAGRDSSVRTSPTSCSAAATACVRSTISRRRCTGPSGARPDYLDRGGRADRRRRAGSGGGPTGLDGASSGLPPRRGGRRRPEHVRDRRLHRINNLGTAVLLEALIEQPGRAAGRRVEHEHLRRGAVPRAGRPGSSPARSGRSGELKPRDWELRDAPGDGWRPVPTPETKAPSLASIYALSKYDQERMCLMVGQRLRHPDAWPCASSTSTAPRQALSNPYTGVLAIFAVAAAQRQPAPDLRGRPPAPRLRQRPRRGPGLPPGAGGPRGGAAASFNVGSGRDATVLEVAAAARRGAGPGATSRRRSPASTAWGTSATASPTSRLARADPGLRAASRASRTAWSSWPAGSRARTPHDRVAEARPNSSHEGWPSDHGQRSPDGPIQPE